MADLEAQVNNTLFNDKFSVKEVLDVDFQKIDKQFFRVTMTFLGNNDHTYRMEIFKTKISELIHNVTDNEVRAGGVTFVMGRYIDLIMRLAKNESNIMYQITDITAPKELTMDDLESILGYKIKIVNGNKPQ